MKKKAIPIYLFSFFMVMSNQALLPVLPMIRDELNASYSQISIFVACISIIRIFLAFPSGLLADRFDRKKILLLSGFLSVGGLLSLVFSRTIFHLIVSRILIGIGSIICTITILVVLAQMADPECKGSMLSMNNVVHNAGGIISSALAGILAGWYNWHLPFFAIGGLIFLSMIVIATTFTDQSPNYRSAEEQRGIETKPHVGKNFEAGILKLAPIFVISLFVFFYRGSFRQILIPFYAKDVFHLDVITLGFYISLLRCIAMASTFVFGIVADRYGRKAALIPGISFSTIAVMALFLPMELNPLLMACILVGVGATINSMPGILISDMAPLSSLGRMMGINRIFGDLGSFLGPITVGSLLDRFGFRVPLYAVAGFSGFALTLGCFSVQDKPIKN